MVTHNYKHTGGKLHAILPIDRLVLPRIVRAAAVRWKGSESGEALTALMALGENPFVATCVAALPRETAGEVHREVSNYN